MNVRYAVNVRSAAVRRALDSAISSWLRWMVSAVLKRSADISRM